TTFGRFGDRLQPHGTTARGSPAGGWYPRRDAPDRFGTPTTPPRGRVPLGTAGFGSAHGGQQLLEGLAREVPAGAGSLGQVLVQPDAVGRDVQVLAQGRDELGRAAELFFTERTPVAVADQADLDNALG